jgi:hypothetical protein
MIINAGEKVKEKNFDVIKSMNYDQEEPLPGMISAGKEQGRGSTRIPGAACVREQLKQQ